MGSTARALSQAGVALLAVYIVILLGGLWPVQLINPAFQLRVGSQLINSAPIALVGLAMLHLAATLDPADPILKARRQRAAALTVAAVLGFLLLIPLLATASLRQQQTQATTQAAELQRAEAQLTAFRQALAASATPADLEQRFKALQGPRLDAADRLQPMPLLRERVSALLDRLGAQLERRRNQVPPLHPLQTLPEILRTSFGSLALAAGFAALARRPGRDLSLLDAWGLAWKRLQRRLRWQRRAAGSNRSRFAPPEEAYIRQLSTDHEERPGGT
jgi:hypothetical protein